MIASSVVYCVCCIDFSGGETLHIFSSPEAAQADVDQDEDRSHVIYDYEVDNPDRHDMPLPRMN